MSSLDQLASLARRLNREAGAPPVPALYFFTDPDRAPDPVSIAQQLPAGAAVVYRHFGARDRAAVARRLKVVCRLRRLALLIANDPDLAFKVDADGVHWPEQHLPAQALQGFRLTTASAHSALGAARAQIAGIDACILAPVFATRSSSRRRPIGLFRASQIARRSRIPIIALGGVNAQTARTLLGRGFAGLAAVDAFVA